MLAVVVRGDRIKELRDALDCSMNDAFRVAEREEALRMLDVAESAGADPSLVAVVRWLAMKR